MINIIYECHIPKSRLHITNKYIKFVNDSNILNDNFLNVGDVVYTLKTKFAGKYKSKKGYTLYLIFDRNNFYLTNFKYVCLG